MAALRDTAFREQQMLKLAKKAILDSGDFLPQDHIAQRLGLPPLTLKATLDEWETEGHIFSIQDSGCSLLPTYVFQDRTEHRPMPELKAILDVLRTKKDVNDSWIVARRRWDSTAAAIERVSPP
jgi:DNA-binding GntR family transcriptional regulator